MTTPRAPILMAIDQGSGSSRALAFDRHGRVLAHATRPLATRMLRPGWVEHSPDDLLRGVKAVLAAAVSDLGRDPIGIGLTTQRSTVILWDRHTGRPLSAAVSWQDRRATEICSNLSAAAARIRRTTGLVLSPYYAAPKLRWLLDRIPGAQQRAERGEVLCGTVNTFLLWHLSDRRLHVTDHTHAARTLLMNLSSLTWDSWLCDLFGIPRAILPTITPTLSEFGEIRAGSRRVPVFASIGDQQAAAFGQGGGRTGDLCLHYGTGAFALLLTGATMIRSPRLLTSIAWSNDSTRSYVLEGTVNTVGSGLAWLQRNWHLPNDLRALDRLAHRSRRPTPFLPALAGLGAPDWDPLAEGIASGFTLASAPQDVVQGFLEGVAFLLARVVAAMPATVSVARITASGGLSSLSALLQSQADFLGRPIRRARLRETSAWGAAALCGVGAGLWRSPDEAVRRVPYDRLFKPSANVDAMSQKKRVWECLLRETRRIGAYTAVSHSA